MMLTLLFILLIPITLVVWLTYVVLFKSAQFAGLGLPISPMRVLLSIVAPIFICYWGLKRKSLSKSGAAVALLVGCVLTLSNYCFFSSLLVFFVTASKVTKFRSKRKQQLDEDFKEGGQRNWVQVVCNGGVATELGIMYLLEIGCGEFPIDFARHYSSSWLSLAVLGVLASSCGDTFASEIGSVIGSGDQRLLINLQRVPRGTNGAVSFAGLVGSILGGAVVGLTFWATLFVILGEDMMRDCPPQWPIIVVGCFSGLIGSAIDSVIGAWLQYSGFDEERKCIVEFPRPGVRHICGVAFLDNHSVNLVTSIMMALIVPQISFYYWKYLV